MCSYPSSSSSFSLLLPCVDVFVADRFFRLGAHLASWPCVAFGRSSCQLASVLGAPLASSPCVPFGNPKFFPHRTSVAGPFGFLCWAPLLPTRFGFGRPSDRLAFLETPSFFPHRTSVAGSLGCVGWALILATRLGFGRPSGRLAWRSSWKPQVFSPSHLRPWLFKFCWLGAPLGDSPWFWAPLWQSRLAFPLETPSFLPTAPLSLVPSVLLVGRSSCRLASVLGAHFAGSPCVPSVNPKFFPHRTSVAGSFGFFCLGAPLGDSPRFWAPLWATRLAFPLETPSFFPTASLSLFFRFCWLGAPPGESPRFWAPLWPSPLLFPLKTKVFSSPRLCRCSFGFVGWALLLATRLRFGRPFGR